MKRQLDNKYKNLVDWVNRMKKDNSLAHVIHAAFELRYEGWINEILNNLGEDLDSSDSNLLTSFIMDIYNDNYELTEPKYYWKLNMPFMDDNITAYIGEVEGHVELVTSKDIFISNVFTKQELIEALSDADTNLTIDNFTPVEEIE